MHVQSHWVTVAEQTQRVLLCISMSANNKSFI